MVLISSQVATVLAWLNYTNIGDVNNMRTILSPNFLDQIRPTSLNVPDLTIEPFLARMAANTIKFGIEPPKPENIVEAGNKVAIWTNSSGSTEHGFPWTNEYTIRFTFEGSKIVNVYEWVDALFVSATLEKEAIIANATNLCPTK